MRSRLDQLGSVSMVERSERVEVAVPSARVRTIFGNENLSWISTASRVPSGDQEGLKPPPTSARFAVPSAFITHSSQEQRWKAILWPSGDHAGSPSPFKLLVSMCTCPPRASISHIPYPK